MLLFSATIGPSADAWALFALREVLIFIANKSVNRKPYLVRTIFFTPNKILSTVTKRQRCRREYLEVYNFLLGDKFLLSLTAILQKVILIRKYDQLKLLQLTFLSIRTISRVSGANKVTKTKKMISKFSNFLPAPDSVFRRNANRALLHCSLMTSI